MDIFEEAKTHETNHSRKEEAAFHAFNEPVFLLCNVETSSGSPAGEVG